MAGRGGGPDAHTDPCRFLIRHQHWPGDSSFSSSPTLPSPLSLPSCPSLFSLSSDWCSRCHTGRKLSKTCKFLEGSSLNPVSEQFKVSASLSSSRRLCKHQGRLQGRDCSTCTAGTSQAESVRALTFSLHLARVGFWSSLPCRQPLPYTREQTP